MKRLAVIAIIAILLSGCVSMDKYDVAVEDNAALEEMNTSLIAEIARLNESLTENQVFFEGHAAQEWADAARQYYQVAIFWYNKYLEIGGEPVQ